MIHCINILSFFFFNDTATTEIYTLSLHDALPIWPVSSPSEKPSVWFFEIVAAPMFEVMITIVLRKSTFRPWASVSFPDRKSTRLNSSHANISYAVFCLKKTKNHINPETTSYSILFYLTYDTLY